LITRPKEVHDGALPSGNSVAALNLLRLARITGSNKLEDMALKQIRTFGAIVKTNPVAFTYFLIAAMFTLYPGQEIVFAGSREDDNILEMMENLHNNFLPHTISILYSQDERGRQLEGLIPFIKGYKPVKRRGAAYICENFACQAPITEVEQFKEALKT